MYIHRLVIDANCINAKGRLEAMTKLESYHDAGVIELLITSTLHKEFSTAPMQKDKSSKYQTISSDCVFGGLDNSGVEAMPGGVSGSSKFQVIFNTLFPEKLKGKVKNRSIRDALHIDQAILNECDYFITHETRLIERSKCSNKINNQISVLAPEDVVIEIQNYFSKNYGTSEPSELNEISKSSGPIILGSNSCYSFCLTDISSGKTVLKCEIKDGLLFLSATFFNDTGIPALIIEPNESINFTDNTYGVNCGGRGAILISNTKCNHFSISSNGNTNLSARLTHFGKIVFYRASLRGMDKNCKMSIYGHTLSIQGMSLS